MTDPVVAPKTAPKPVTTKHLAYELAEQHQLSKKQGLELMEELVGMITKHLKKGERVKIMRAARFRTCRIPSPAWAAIRRPVRQSRSRPAERSPSARPRNSRRRSDRQAPVASALPHKLNSPALFLLLLPSRRRHQVRNHSHRTLGIAVHRPCLFQRHHHRCSLDKFSCVHPIGMLPRPPRKSGGFI